MKCQLGYVSLALDLEKVTLSNLQDLEKILNYNIENDIHFYRLTSNLVILLHILM